MLLTTRVTKAAFTAVGGVEIFHQIKFSLYYRNKNHLGDAFARLNGEAVLTTVPNGNHQLALIVRIDQSYQVTKHDTVLMSQSGARQHHCRQ